MGDTDVQTPKISDGQGQTTLRDAITQADSGTANQYVIKLAVKGTIDLTSALPDLSNNITILGPGAKNLTIQRDPNAPDFPVFTTINDYVINGEAITISGMTICNGNSQGDGGGIFDLNNALTVNSDIFVNNFASVNGGGIFCYGTLTVSNSTFINNNCSLGGLGGGIYSNTYEYYTYNISNSIFINNSATSGGGGIYDTNAGYGNSLMNVNACVFIDNTVSSSGVFGGGGIDNAGNNMMVTDCLFVGNTTASNGGGILNLGNAYGNTPATVGILTVNDSVFIGNSAVEGGGIANISGTLTNTRNLFFDNTGGDIYS